MNGHDLMAQDRAVALDRRIGELMEVLSVCAGADRGAGRFKAAEEKEELISLVRERLRLAADRQCALELAVVQMHRGDTSVMQ